MRQIFAGSICGLMFGSGILISGMGNPAKVLNFFDVAGTWDASLALVMASGLLVALIGYRVTFAMPGPLFAATFDLPKSARIDWPLVLGAGLFGVGWGLSGFCPGGLIPMLGLGAPEPWTFFAAMVIGMIAARWLLTKWARRRQAGAAGPNTAPI